MSAIQVKVVIIKPAGLRARGATSDDGRRREIGLKALDILLRRTEGIAGGLEVTISSSRVLGAQGIEVHYA